MSDYSLVPGRRCVVGPKAGTKDEANGPVTKRMLTPEEMAEVIAKYGPPKFERKTSPLVVLTDTVIQEKNRKSWKGGKGNGKSKNKTCGREGCQVHHLPPA